MKYMIISDIHGDIDKLNKVLDIFSKENCSKLLILGDLFNYGIDYNRDYIIERLNLMKNNIIAVSGNCDNNLTGIQFDMPYIRSFTLNNKQITLTHGHLYTKEDLFKSSSDLLFVGHSHISNIEKRDNKILINPGSISKSRRGENSFCIVDESTITIRNLYNEIIEKAYI